VGVVVVVLDATDAANSFDVRVAEAIMKAVTALNAGGRQALRLRKLVVFFYLVNLVAAFLAVAPAIALIHGRLAHSFENDRLFPNFDVAWMIETLAHFRWWPLAGIGTVAAIVAVLYLILNAFLAGGALAVCHHEDAPFFSSCAKYFLRLLRLLLISALCYGAVLVLNRGMAAAVTRLREGSMVESTWTILGWFRLLLVAFLLGVVNMIFDYGKIVCVADNRRSAFRATLAALRFASRFPGRTLAVYWTCAGFGLLFLLAYHGITEAAGQGSRSTVLLVLVLRQALMLVRMWLRLWTWSSELHVYTFNSTIVAPEPPSLAAAG
jgi:hypothetical protein